MVWSVVLTAPISDNIPSEVICSMFCLVLDIEVINAIRFPLGGKVF